jgi:hypothetical protein
LQILKAVHAFVSSVKERFDGVDRGFDDFKNRVTKIEATMVTKDCLDDKLSDLHSDIVTFVKGRVPGLSEA